MSISLKRLNSMSQRVEDYIGYAMECNLEVDKAKAAVLDAQWLRQHADSIIVSAKSRYDDARKEARRMQKEIIVAKERYAETFEQAGPRVRKWHLSSLNASSVTDCR